jgi:glycosyltransferase involved in cell wall biosynthesis
MAPRVTVIMNCLNGEKYLRESIDSVFAQRFQDWEIVFFDNASTDRTEEIARSYGPQLRYFRSDKILKLGAARNEAIKLARGEFIAFLDCDDVWLPAKLEKQMPLFADPEVGLVYCDTIIFNNAGDERRMYSYRRFARGYCFDILLVDYFMSMQTVVLRRTALEAENHWFDPRFEAIEEADLFRRIAYRWKIDLANEPLGKWRVHAESTTWSKAYLFAEENELLLEKYHQIFPDFARRYAAQIPAIRRNIARGKAQHRWRSGHHAEARRLLWPYVFTDWKTAVQWIATFFRPERLDRLRQAGSTIRVVPR